MSVNSGLIAKCPCPGPWISIFESAVLGVGHRRHAENFHRGGFPFGEMEDRKRSGDGNSNEVQTELEHLRPERDQWRAIVLADDARLEQQIAAIRAKRREQERESTTCDRRTCV